MQNFLFTAIRAAKAAAAIHRAFVGRELDIHTKSSDTDLVTQVDRESEARIREVILGEYPDHVVMGEELGASAGAGSHRWIVDPLDGTLNYAHGFPFYCVSVALEIAGRIEVGVVLDSVRDELFTAIREGGSFANGAPIAVSTESSLKRAMLATGFSYEADAVDQNLLLFQRVMPKVRAIRRPGAAALELCYVACGRLDGFWELDLNSWDVAAGMLIIQEAGGTLTAGGGQPYTFANKAVVASNGHLHARLIDALNLDKALA